MHNQPTEAGVDADARFAERLLRGGVAPRHVRRSLRELRDHHADLTSQFRQQGHDDASAAREARQLLGHPDALAGQILARPELRSRVRRFAWLVFGIGPPLACGALAIGAAMALGITRGEVLVPILLSLWLVPAALCTLLGFIALRRRMPHTWPVVGMALTVLISGATGIEPNWMYIINPGFPGNFDTTRTLILLCGSLLAYVLAICLRRASCPGRWEPFSC